MFDVAFYRLHQGRYGRRFVREKSECQSADLVPGLWIKVQGVGDQSRFMCLQNPLVSRPRISRTAHAIQSGFNAARYRGFKPTNVRFQTNVQNIQATQQQVQNQSAGRFQAKSTADRGRPISASLNLRTMTLKSKPRLLSISSSEMQSSHRRPEANSCSCQGMWWH